MLLKLERKKNQISLNTFVTREILTNNAELILQILHL